MPPPFNPKDRIKILLWCDRHCCLCGKFCGTNIVIHHIETEGENLSEIDNALPLCLDCHGKVGSYNPEHPVGTKYKVEELKARRDQIYDEYTQHLVPPVYHTVTQLIGRSSKSRKLPNVGFNLHHAGGSLPVNVKVEVKTLLGDDELGMIEDRYGYYSVQTPSFPYRCLTLGRTNLVSARAYRYPTTGNA